jgi:hypothetical protein
MRSYAKEEKDLMKTPHSIALMMKNRKRIDDLLLLVVGISFVLTLSLVGATVAPAWAEMDMEQTLSDGAQRSTIAFDGFALITGSFEAQSFFPPGKVADYWGFQYLRDNTPNGNGHNTSFLTNCAFNILYILNDNQFAMLKALATNQVDQINLYAYKRFPLMKAFRRQLDGDIPAGASGLSLAAVKAASSDLYALDGQISFDRAVVYAFIYRTLDASQKVYLDAMKAGGFGSWTVTTQMDSAVRNRMRGVSQDVSVALMTYAGDLFSWYAGSLEADVYFCPERQGTYFGSFYVKDAPAIGHEGYKIDEALTANAGQYFLDQLAATGLDGLVTGLVDQQRDSLYIGANNIVKVRTDISMLLRSLITASVLTDQLKAEVLAQVLAKSRTYGELDGEIVHSYAMAFAQVYQFMNDEQKANLANLRKTIMSGVYNGVPFDFSVCTTPFLYSAVINDTSVLAPYLSNTDFLFVFENKATLISPSGTIATNSPSYVWNAVAGATWYCLWVDDSTGNKVNQWYSADEAGCSSGTGTCTISPGTALTAGSAKWWVRTWNSNGYGPWSDSMAFTAPTAVIPGKASLISPSESVSTNIPSYIWNAVPNSTWYCLWVNDSTGNKINRWYSAVEAGCSSGTGTCTISPGIALAPGSAKWWVRTWYANGYGPWSDAMVFTASARVFPGKASLSSPSGTINTNIPTYVWNAVSGSTWYCLWVDESSGTRVKKWFKAAEVGCSSGTGTCSVTPDIALAAGSAKWWIGTWNANGSGPWSNGMVFTASAPILPRKATLESPSGTIGTNKPTYTWNADPYASWYYLWVDDSGGTRIKKWFTAADAGCSSGIGTCSVTPDIALAAGSAKWWIGTWNANGSGPWSNGMVFTVSAASEFSE